MKQPPLQKPRNRKSNPDAGNAEWTGSEAGATVKMIIQRPENTFYKNLQEKRKVESARISRQTIPDQRQALDAFQWKITGEQPLILDYPCIKAVYQKEDKTTVAWFTPQIPVSLRTGHPQPTPGMILAVDVSNGERTLTAAIIPQGETQEEMLKEPTKGKEVTPEEYDQIEADVRGMERKRRWRDYDQDHGT
ncbi:MAG: GLPGLI family protein [Saprospirales bacterium]|nr:GLPGLI family protein [Saprospirales bacterium]